MWAILILCSGGEQATKATHVYLTQPVAQVKFYWGWHNGHCRYHGYSTEQSVLSYEIQCYQVSCSSRIAPVSCTLSILMWKNVPCWFWGTDVLYGAAINLVEFYVWDEDRQICSYNQSFTQVGEQQKVFIWSEIRSCWGEDTTCMSSVKQIVLPFWYIPTWTLSTSQISATRLPLRSVLDFAQYFVYG